MKEHVLPSPSKNVKIYITGYYINKQGKRRYGFVKRDARKKQTVWVKDMDTLERYRLSQLNKKDLKALYKNVDRYIKKRHKTFRGKKFEKVEPEIEEVRVSLSKPFDRRIDQGEYRRMEGMERLKKSEDFRSHFYSAFSQGLEIKAKFVVINVYLEVTFKHRRNYSYTSDFFIFSKRYYTDLGASEIGKEFRSIMKKIVKRMRELNIDYKESIKHIKYVIRDEWLIPTEMI